MTVVVGADGVVGSEIASALGASRVVFRTPLPPEVSIDAADELLRGASVVVNASGFRVRPGLTESDYRRSHAGAVGRLVPRLSKGTLLIQISSASVLGKGSRGARDAREAERPESFGCPSYALAKLEAEERAREAAASAGLRLAILRPAILYGSKPDGMVGTLLSLAARGVLLRLVPSSHRHHLCSFPLLLEAVRSIVRTGATGVDPLALADPFVLTSDDLAATLASIHPPRVAIPFPAALAGSVLRRFPRARSPRLDLRTWGEILSILAIDTVYDTSGTYRLLGIDPARFSRSRTWERLVRGLEAEA